MHIRSASLLLCALMSGAVMGCSDLRPLQILYSAIKLPLLLVATFAIAVPSFVVINTVAGVRRDLGRVLRALIESQVWLTFALCSLSPLTLLWYASTADHDMHIVFNAGVIGIASVAGQVVLRRRYAPLILIAPIHARLMKLWLALCAFVGIQAAWVLRPFVGDPTRATQFLRDDPWTNAYVWVGRMVGRVLFR